MLLNPPCLRLASTDAERPVYRRIGAMVTFAARSLVVFSSLAGCVTPRVTQYYDEECQVVSKHIDLDVEQRIEVGQCTNQDCVWRALTGVAVFATSAVVSGSIAVVGNTAYWLERTAKCQRAST